VLPRCAAEPFYPAIVSSSTLSGFWPIFGRSSGIRPKPGHAIA